MDDAMLAALGYTLLMLAMAYGAWDSWRANLGAWFAFRFLLTCLFARRAYHFWVESEHLDDHWPWIDNDPTAALNAWLLAFACIAAVVERPRRARNGQGVA